MILELTTSLKTGRGEIFHPGKYNSKTRKGGIPKPILQEYEHHVKRNTLAVSCIRVIELDPKIDSEEVLDHSETLEAGKTNTNTLAPAATDQNDGSAPSTEKPSSKGKAKPKLSKKTLSKKK